MALLGLALTAVPQASAARREHGHRRDHRHDHHNAMLLPEHGPPVPIKSETGLIDPTPTPYKAEEGSVDNLPPAAIVPLAPGTPDPQDPLPLASNIAAFEEPFEKRTAPMARSSGAGSGGGYEPHPPNRRLGFAFEEPFEKRTAPMARSSGAGSGGGYEPYPPNRQLGLPQSAALAFFLSAIGFFFLSLIWNLYLQVGLARDQAKKIDGRAVQAMRTGVSPAPLGLLFARGDGAAKGGEGAWLRGANAPVGPAAA
ncbi:hypothetical protein G647_05309 [Cladophialophora carrionii CBS 160.54]|uniref:Uncharacterized protein n=1 Tax=Cladophialophora carrionii CBS 160.54 TaxID=1279043 RepID=V9DC10_9EURO|nr:uncharacterized protein G647_05309 [Cladophialophora carrionii CBS 160.54]ETI23507.1 hypothetical protein G647_05309 [Cladophialophora carrionii CBS 160.54]